MKLFIKTIALLLALLCCVSLFACEKDEQPKEDNSDIEESQGKTDEDSAEGESAEGSDTGKTTSRPATQTNNKILSKDLSKYTLVVAENASEEIKYAAECLKLVADKRWKTEGSIKADSYAKASEQKYELLIGNTNRPESKSHISKLKSGEGGWSVLGSKLVIAGYDDSLTATALGRFATTMMISLSTNVPNYITDKNNKTENMSGMISIMSFNVYVGIGNDSVKTKAAIDTIRSYNPDIFGVQEASDAWKNKLNNAFKNEYTIIGHGRESGKNGEATQIFIRKSKFRVVSSGTKWLTDTPDKYSSISGSICPRIATYAVLETEDGKIFNYVNTHLDHSSNENVRVAQIGYLADIIEKNTDTSKPTYITGDFNMYKGSVEYSALQKLGYQASLDVADKVIGKNSSTFSGGGIIDFCFVANNNNSTTLFYRVADEELFGESSDHYPVYTVIKY